MNPDTGMGRPSLLDIHGITVDDLKNDYARLGTYRAVADLYDTSIRTICRYIGGTNKRGRKKGSYRSASRRFIDEHPELIVLGPMEASRRATEEGNLAPWYVRQIVTEKRNAMLSLVKEKVRTIVHETVAVRDTKGRYIPTKAIRYVWIPRWEWYRPVFVRVVLRDGTKSKLPTLYRPDPTDVISRWDWLDR